VTDQRGQLLRAAVGFAWCSMPSAPGSTPGPASDTSPSAWRQQEHRHCERPPGRSLDGGIEDDRVWISCTCGAEIHAMVQRYAHLTPNRLHEAVERLVSNRATELARN